MAKNIMLNFGRCSCGGRFEARRFDVTMTVNSQPVKMKEINYGYCPLCERRVYRQVDLARIEALMRGAQVDFSAAVGAVDQPMDGTVSG